MIRPSWMICLLCLSAVLAPCAIAQKGGGSKPKPAPPKGASDAKLGAIGTTQLPGEWCDFGKAYTLGKSLKLNINLASVEYSAIHFPVGKEFVFPDDESKLMVVRYTIHNPNPKEVEVGQRSLKLTAVDAKGQNRDHLFTVILPSNEPLQQTLKPAQKIEVASVFSVSASGPVPKLMVAAADQAQPVTRYDLKGKVKMLAAPYTDPSDPHGSSLPEELSGKIGDSIESYGIELRVEKAAFVQPISGIDVEPWSDDQAGLMITLAAACYREQAISIENGTFAIRLVDADGGSSQLTQTAIAASSDRRLEMWLKKGQPIKFRVLFVVPKGVEMKKITFFTGEKRPISVDLGGIKG